MAKKEDHTAVPEVPEMFKGFVPKSTRQGRPEFIQKVAEFLKFCNDQNWKPGDPGDKVGDNERVMDPYRVDLVPTIHMGTKAHEKAKEMGIDVDVITTTLYIGLSDEDPLGQFLTKIVVGSAFGRSPTEVDLAHYSGGTRWIGINPDRSQRRAANREKERESVPATNPLKDPE